MKKLLSLVIVLCAALSLNAQEQIVSSPDGKLSVTVFITEGKPYYKVSYNGVPMLEDSPLGLVTSVADLSHKLELQSHKNNTINKQYTQDRIKQSAIHYQANELILTLANDKKQHLDIVFRVSNNDIAFKYNIHRNGKEACCTVEKELTGFNFPQHATTFLTPQATPMIGWERTKPSYEEEYVPDEAMGTPSKYGVGYTFPGLFHIGNDGWVLVSETGVSSAYCGAKLSEGTKDGLYRIAYPELRENNSIGSASPSIPLPGETPWRTLTVSDNLKPIVETTIPFNVVEPLYEPSQDYQFGRSTWSWIMWQDHSVNFDDQIRYIDLAAALGYEYALIDGLWDKQIGYEKMEELFKYAKTKGVAPFVWYNSNGYWNDAPQGPRQKMNTSAARKKEMKWLKEHGVKGLKVDFFGGDKQETMKLYEDILVEANEYGLMIIFHGCTLPRGWERMYPNFVGSEAVLASENLIFQQHFNDEEAYNACLHPFIRNAVGSMEFGPVLLNKRHNRENNGGTTRRTTEIFQLVTGILFQSPVQMFAIAPNNLTDQPEIVVDFMKNIPTTWDETVFIDGYPGKYVVLARRTGETWYVMGINAEKEAKKLKVNLPMLAGKEVSFYSDKKDRSPQLEKVKIKNNGEVLLTIPTGGGIIYKN